MADESSELQSALEEARSRLEEERWSEASTVLQRVCASPEVSGAAHLLLGRAATALLDWELAANSYASAVQLGLATHEAWTGLGNALAALNRLDDARKAYIAALELESSDAKTHSRLASTLHILGHQEVALSHFERAVELGLSSAHEGRSRLLAEMGRVDEAIVAIGRALEGSEETAALRLQLGHLFLAAERLEEGETEFRRAYELAPNWPQPARHLGRLLAGRGRFEEAAACFVGAVTGQPGKHEEGFESYFGGLTNTRIAEIVIDPEHVPAYEELSRLLKEQGLDSEAELVRECTGRLRTGGLVPVRHDDGPATQFSPAASGMESAARVPIPLKGPDGATYATDKITSNPERLAVYEEVFARFVDQPIVMLELGIYEGGSLLMWRDYFKKGTIVGLDINPAPIEPGSDSIRIYQGYQEDLALLDRIAAETAPDGYSIVIDDASHRGDLTRLTFGHVFNRHLKPGGVYVIEDWQSGYLPDWLDGQAFAPQADVLETTADGESRRRLPSHDFGMVGLVKQLLDQANDFDRILVAKNRVFVFKEVPGAGT